MINNPWDFLDDFRSKEFTGAWPTLAQLFQITCQRFPDREFLVLTGGRRLTYAQALNQVQSIAGHLGSLGFKPGDHGAVCGAPTPGWALAYLGILWAGGVVVPLDHQLKDAELWNLLKASGARFFFCEKPSGLNSQAAPGLQAFSILPEEPQSLYQFPPNPQELQKRNSSDLAALLFTSGTTATPKGVMLTHHNLVSDCFLAQAHMRIFPTDKFYVLLPMHHAYTMLAVFIESFSVGAALVFGTKMAVSQVLQDLKTEQVTMLLGVPMLFNKLLAGIESAVAQKGPGVAALLGALMALSGLIKNLTGLNPGKVLFGSILRKAGLATLRICISGGGPLARRVFQKLNQLGLDFVQGYGLTETSPILALNPVKAFRVHSVGRILPQVEVKILNPTEDGVGEIAVRGPMVMPGYYQNPKATAEVLDSEGWFKTGDLGRIEAPDYLILTGRAKNVIVTPGGKNVYPEEIEDAFQLFPLVEQILIRGYKARPEDPAESIEALIYPQESETAAKGAPAVKEEIQKLVDTVNTTLRSHQRISRVVILESPLEMTTTRKIKRR